MTRPRTAPLVTLDFPKAPKYGPAERAAVLRVLDEGHLSDTGRSAETAALEDAFAHLTGARYALSFNSGTASLHAALHAAGAQPDAGVLMSPLTWISAITAAFHARSYPVFCDVLPGTPNLNPAAAQGKPASAILITHAYGIPAPMDRYRRDVPLIEDCSHAHGAVFARQPVGSWGAAGCFSLQETKAVSAGEGGILTTSDRGIYERAMLLGHHPQRLQREITDPELIPLARTGAAHKFRIPTLAAALAAVQTATLPTRMAAAQANLDRARHVWDDHDIPLTLPKVPAGSKRGFYGTPLTVTRTITNPDALFRACVAENIPLRRLYDDWLTSPLLQSPQAVRSFWPHTSNWKPPQPGDFPGYYQARRQTLILKIPTVPAEDYMHQVALALVHILNRASGAF